MNSSNYKRRLLTYTKIVLLSFFLISFFYRVIPLAISHPMWNDEFSSAYQAQIIRSQPFRFLLNPKLEYNNYITHVIIAISFSLFGVSEFAARIPFVVIGSIIPIIGYLFLKKTYSQSSAYSGLLFLSFSYFQITWSNQARGYLLQQLLGIIFIFLAIKYFKSKKKRVAIIQLVICSVLGLLTHKFFIFWIIALMIFKLTQQTNFFKKKKYFQYILLSLMGVFILRQINLFSAIESQFVGLHNNLWYYHSFFWKYYPWIVIFALLGWYCFIKRNQRIGFVISIYILLHLVFINFLFVHYISKYTIPIFSWLLIFASIGVSETVNHFFITKKISQKIISRRKSLLTILSSIFLIINDSQFVYKPQKYYSLNYTVREIAIVDYNLLYSTIRQSIRQSNTEVAVIDTWNDRFRWYMGSDVENFYRFRWCDKENTRKKTDYVINNGNKYIVNPSSKQITNIKLMCSVTDLTKILSNYPKGFIWIDDNTLPVDVINYAEQNFKKELFLDHYKYDENPYSIWPGTLYSWGFDETIEVEDS